MSRLTRFGWLLLALLVVTVVLAFVAPGLAIIGAAVLALALLGIVAEGVMGLAWVPTPDCSATRRWSSASAMLCASATDGAGQSGTPRRPTMPTSPPT
jgi:lysylphosphatidylglycerol synthetase-like protein (DUF2156 family)